MNDLPMFLHGYEPLQKLMEWIAQGEPESERRWTIRCRDSVFGRPTFACILDWFPKEATQNVELSWERQTLQEAVFGVLEAFRQNQKDARP